MILLEQRERMLQQQFEAGVPRFSSAFRSLHAAKLRPKHFATEHNAGATGGGRGVVVHECTQGVYQPQTRGRIQHFHQSAPLSDVSEGGQSG